MQGIFCLMLGGFGLSDESRTLLYKSACEMYQKNMSRVAIKSEECEGTIRTKMNYARLGCYSGTKFIADIEGELGKSHVEFIVQDWDLKTALEYGEWFDIIPLPEDHPANKAQYN